MFLSVEREMTIDPRDDLVSLVFIQVTSMFQDIVEVTVAKRTKDDVQVALDSKKRAAGGPTAPPDGLYLVEVVY